MIFSLILVLLCAVSNGDTDIIGDYGHARIYRTNGNEIKVDWMTNARPTATGTINEPTGANIFYEGSVNFPDDRKYVARFYPDDNRIYWDGLRGQTHNIWVKTQAFDVSGTYAHADISRLGGNVIEVDWVNGYGGNGHRQTAKGTYNGPVDSDDYARGEVTFPDDRQYELRFYPDDNKIYWDGLRGTSQNIWSKEGQDILGTYGSSNGECFAVISCTEGNGITVDWINWSLNGNRNRPTAYGTYKRGAPEDGFGNGKVTFPDDRTYTALFYQDDGRIYWDGLRGQTNNIWYPCTCGEAQSAYSLPLNFIGENGTNIAVNKDGIIVLLVVANLVSIMSCAYMYMCMRGSKKGKYAVVSIEESDDEVNLLK